MMSAHVVDSDRRGTRAMDATRPMAWAVVSESAAFVGLYYFEGHATSMMRDPAAPNDAVMFALQEVPGSRRYRKSAHRLD
jgi:hypothetical protein